MHVSLDLQIACSVDSIPRETEVREWLQQAYQAGRPDASGTAEVSVRIVDVNESRELNNRYRQKDRPTNVLAFPAAVVGLPEDAAEVLGDLVLCAPLVESEAREQGKSVSTHWAHLLVHGLLHLLGYDHETPIQAAKMESMEKSILADRGIEDPYQVA